MGFAGILSTASPGEDNRQRYLLPAANQTRCFHKQANLLNQQNQQLFQAGQISWSLLSAVHRHELGCARTKAQWSPFDAGEDGFPSPPSSPTCNT